jgi:uncharacterized protein YuzE
MKYEYDKEGDILLIKLREGKLEFGEQEGNIITHYDSEYKPIEIEILDASKTTLEMLETIFKSIKSTKETA